MKPVAYKKVVNNNLDQNLNGNNFDSVTSQTIFTLGEYAVTSNFEGRKYIDYSNTLSSFARPITLETLGLTHEQSEIVQYYDTNAVLNLDKSDLNTFVRFGSAYEFLRVSIQNVITQYPGSLFMSYQQNRYDPITLTDFTYDSVTNTTIFNIPTGCTINTFKLAIDFGNVSLPDDKEYKNLNLSYDKYVIWSSLNSGNTYPVIGFTGYTSGRRYLIVKTLGNPFPFLNSTVGSFDYHLKPNNMIFEEFRVKLNDYEKYIVSRRNGYEGFIFAMKDPTLLDDGMITYADTQIIWNTTDYYNIDTNNGKYRTFLESVLSIANKYDKIKTDLIARFLTPTSIKAYDLTQQGKMTKLLRIYGREFDQLRQFIDSLVNINKITYDKLNNVPDQLVKNLSRTFGWNYFSLVAEEELVESFFTIDEKERNLDKDLLPAEIDIELWRRIIMNTSYFWKSKGTREAIKSMFLLIGIPEPFINITEYVYTVDGKINPNTVQFTLTDFPSNSLPYDNDGYPVAPLETNNFYFQMSGDTDSGQAYLNVFRKAGFNLNQTVDNKKSWIQTGAAWRVDDTTPQYYQEDSKLVINTKEVDIALDTARGIEYDVYNYIRKDFEANSTGYTLPYSFVNLSLNYPTDQDVQVFDLPVQYTSDKIKGYLEIRYNGILLTPAKFYDGSTIFDTPIPPFTDQYDYVYNPYENKVYIKGGFARNSGNRRDVIHATFVYSGQTSPVTGITVQYIVARVSPNVIENIGVGVRVPLPSFPRGDVQLTINGIALTKASGQFIGDYVLDPLNSTGGTNNIIITNPSVVGYLANPAHQNIQIAYVQVDGSNDINARSEIVRVDSFNNNKIYFNPAANKYVYKMNYKANNASDIKVLVDGIALEPMRDYDINQQNKFEVYLPKGIKYGSIISVYYLVGNQTIYFPIVETDFGVGDISKLSFLEFIEMIQRRMINARNRKTVTDFSGGWYPALLKIYTEYLKRADLPVDNPMKSNGYTFDNLYPFLSKYNAFFQRFIDQLLSATIILRKSGLLIRNTVFTKQKFTYKRGVNIPKGDTSNKDKREDVLYPYLGDDGSIFKIDQGLYTVPPSATAPVVSTAALNNITQTSAQSGGVVQSDGGSPVTARGVVWSTTANPTIANNKTTQTGNLGSFSSNISGLIANTGYHVRAYATNAIGTSYGQDLEFYTEAIPIVPSVVTKTATNITQTTFVSGGMNIPDNVYGLVESYGIQLKRGVAYWQTPPVAGPLTGNNYETTVTGLDPNTTYEYRACIIVGGIVYNTDFLTVTTAQVTPVLPTVTTSNVQDITQNSAHGGGEVTSEGTSSVTERGIVWSTSQNPTTDLSTKQIGSGSVFTAMMNGLQPYTTYYVRAYAISAAGTAYGNQVSFVTSQIPMLYFSGVNGSNEVLMNAENHVAGNVYAVTLYYVVQSDCGINIDGPNNNTSIGHAELGYSADGVNTLIAESNCEVHSSDGPIYDSDTVTGFTTITITNLSTFRLYGSWQYSGDRIECNGSYGADIVSVTIANGGGIAGIKCPNSASAGGGYNYTPYLSCTT